MAALLQTHLVKFQCSCSSFKSIYEMYMCRSCSALKCNACYSSSPELIFCGACFENITFSEAREARMRCQACYECPVCASALTLINIPVDGVEHYKLLCPNCRYSSLDAGFALVENKRSFYPSKIEDQSCVETREVRIEELTAEQNEVDRVAQLKTPKKRKYTTLKASLNDTYGLASAYNARRIAVEDSLCELDDSVAALDLSVTTTSETDEAEEIISRGIMETANVKLPKSIIYEKSEEEPDIAYDGYYAPIPRRLQTRWSRRCNDCNFVLLRAGYNPTSIDYRAKHFAIYYVPVLRIVKPVDLIVNVEQPGFFCLLNNSQFPMKIIIRIVDVDADNHIKCAAAPVVTEIPVSITTDNLDDHIRLTESIRQGNIDGNSVVFKAGNTVAIHLDLTAKAELEENFILLEMEFEAIVPEHVESNPKAPTSWKGATQIRVNLGSSRTLKEGEDVSSSN